MIEKPYDFETDWIYKLEKEAHWRAYWQQQKIIEGELDKNDSILEIGKGTGFCSNYLKSKGYNIKTIDIDEGKNPDIVGNIVDYEFAEEFDHIIAFEVFEHIPFRVFKELLPKIKKCVRKSLVVSIPESTIILMLADIRFPVVKHVRFGIRLQQRFLPGFLKMKLSKYHHWELNYKNEYSVNSIKKILDKHDLKITLHIRSHFNNHNFFVIKDRNSE